jgi:hypothetical protein
MAHGDITHIDIPVDDIAGSGTAADLHSSASASPPDIAPAVREAVARHRDQPKSR